jgi:hypothetical protein
VPGTSRNQFRMSATNSLDVRVTWTVPLPRSQKIQFSLDAFNLYNEDNVATVNGTWGANPASPLGTFGAPLTYFNPRELQLAARFLF